MRQQLSEFEEFEAGGETYTTDLGSAEFDFSDGVVRLQGRCITSDSPLQVEVVVDPEDTADFNVSVSASDGSLSGQDLVNFEGELVGVYDVETGDDLA